MTAMYYYPDQPRATKSEIRDLVTTNMKNLASTAFVSVACLSTTISGLAIVPRAVDPATTDPNDDPFYAVPANISKYTNGQLIDSRPVTTVVQQGFTNAFQLKFRTTDGQGKAVSTLATLWLPTVPANPPKVFGYQTFEDAINLDCAPSWAWLANSNSDNEDLIRTEGQIYIPWALHNGYYVIQPDAEGPQSTWLVGRMEGQATLDAVRAAIQYNKLDNSKTKVALYGYSGGAHSTVWAASLAQSYAKELNIVGAAYGGTPVDLISTFELLNGQNSSILAGVALFGLALGYPNLQNNYQTGADGLTTQGKAVQKFLEARRNCPASNPGNFSYTDWNTYFKGPLLQNQVLLDVGKRESLLSNVSSLAVPVPTFPRFEFHGNNDTTVPYGPEAAYVQQQCSKGANIQFRTFNGADHGTTDVEAILYAQDFLTKAFNGNTPTCVCGTTNCQ